MTAVKNDSNVGTRSKQQLIEIARSYLTLAEDDNQKSQREQRLAPILNALSSNIFRLVIMGEVKKGKSSFINALLGQAELLPTTTNVATSTVYKIVHGPRERLTAYPLPTDDAPDETPAALEICRDQLPEYGTEDRNPGNVKRVDFIAVEMPHPLLAQRRDMQESRISLSPARRTTQSTGGQSTSGPVAKRTHELSRVW